MPPIRVLLVDDDLALLETTCAILSELSSGEITVDTASSAEDALRRLDAQRTNVVVSDFHMPPGMSGVELLKAVKARGVADCGILITGLRDQMPKGAGRDEAIFAVVYKPYDPDALMQTIRDATRFQRMTATANGLSNRMRSGRNARDEG